MKVSDHLHTVDVSIIINKPARIGVVRSPNGVRVSDHLPWALRHDKGPSSEDGSDDTLYE